MWRSVHAAIISVKFSYILNCNRWQILATAIILLQKMNAAWKKMKAEDWVDIEFY